MVDVRDRGVFSVVALAKRAGVGDQERHTARPLAPMSSISATILQSGLPKSPVNFNLGHVANTVD